jgi:hypothetical protein
MCFDFDFDFDLHTGIREPRLYLPDGPGPEQIRHVVSSLRKKTRPPVSRSRLADV